ncbi:MAG TPA: DUF3332 family protein [Deltaproteobacteria bacterium]|jgi:hypothetical protein|nr:DUF3332 family protein [Deltaproteobacteria bacterium]HOI07083.1 DUF3332 family protein [Deltaproteobacteria bacterium]
MKKIAITVLLASMIAISCTGTFQLTQQVHKFQTQPEDKWVEEILFLAFVIIPVYGAATLVDAVVFNSIEFWTGENPMQASLNGTENVIVQNGNEGLSMKYDAESRDIRVASTSTGDSFILSRTDNGVVAKNSEGEVLFTSVEDSQGGVTILDRNNRAIRHYSPDEVQKQRAQFFTRQADE